MGTALRYQNIWDAINISNSLLVHKNNPMNRRKKENNVFSVLTQFSHFTVIFHRLSFFVRFYQICLVWWHVFFLFPKKTCLIHLEGSFCSAVYMKTSYPIFFPLLFPLKLRFSFLCTFFMHKKWNKYIVGDAARTTHSEKFFFARNNFLFNHRNVTNVIRERKIRMVNVTKCSVDDENKFCQDLLLLRLARKMFLFQSNEKIHLWANYCYWWLQISDSSNLVLSLIFFSREKMRTNSKYCNFRSLTSTKLYQFRSCQNKKSRMRIYWV